MPLVASVRLRYASQDYWFDPAGLDIKAGDHVLVETSKGNEIGLCTHDVVDVDEVEVTSRSSPSSASRPRRTSPKATRSPRVTRRPSRFFTTSSRRITST